MVENRPGGSGNSEPTPVAKAEPDGYTLLFVLDNPLTVNPVALPQARLRFVGGFCDRCGRELSLTLVVHPPSQ